MHTVTIRVDDPRACSVGSNDLQPDGPPAHVQTMRLLEWFFNELRNAPHQFKGHVLEAVYALERVLDRIGIKLEEVGLHRRLVFKDAMRVVAAA